MDRAEASCILSQHWVVTLFYSAVLPASRWISESQHSLSLSDIKQTDSKMLATHLAHSLSPPQACPGSGWEAGSVRVSTALLPPLRSVPLLTVPIWDSREGEELRGHTCWI